MTQTLESTINGVNVQNVHKLVEDIQRDPQNAQTFWKASTRWVNGTQSETSISSCRIGTKTARKDFKIRVDEPLELAGANAAPNPQEYLLAALNACMTVGYVAQASLEGIKLESLEIESSGEIDLRGFLGLDTNVKPGYDSVQYTVRIKGDGTPAQFAKIHETVMKTSPNRFNFANPIKLTSELVVE